MEPPVLVSRLEADPAPATVLGIEGQGVGRLVDGSVVNLVNGCLVCIRVHVISTVYKIKHKSMAKNYLVVTAQVRNILTQI